MTAASCQLRGLLTLSSWCCAGAQERMCAQLVAGLAVPVVLSYFLDRWQRASFVRQLRSEEAGRSSRGGAVQRAPVASSRDTVELLSGSEQSSVAAGDQAGAVMDSADGDGGSAPMLADLLLVSATLPLVCAVGWQLLGLCFRT